MPTFVAGSGTGDNYGNILLPVIDVDWFKQALFGALFELSVSDNWIETGDIGVSFAVEEAAQMIAGFTFMNFNPIPIAKIEAFALTTAPPGWLACDGSTYTEEQYPELYAAIDPTFKDTDEHLVFTPLIYPGQTIIQYGDTAYSTPIAFADSNINEQITIAIDNLPSHHHTVPLTATTLAFEPGEITVTTPVPFFTQNTGDTGGDVPITAFAPYYALSYFIYAGRV